MSDGVRDIDEPHGTSLLPHPLTKEELAALPVFSPDDFVIEDLTDEEYEAFLAALDL
jgi:hypothetical protein